LNSSFPEPLSPVTPGEAHLWNESQLFWWFDRSLGLYGVHRIGHQPNNPPGVAQMWHAILSSTGDRFRRCVETRLEPKWRGANLYRASDLEFRYSEQGVHACYQDAECAMDLQFTNFHIPLDPSSAGLDLNSQGVKDDVAATLFAGHVVAAGSIKGNVEFGGRSLTIDAMGFRDHSWGGQRDVRPMRVTHWAVGTTGPAFSFSMSHATLSNGSVYKTAFVLREGVPTPVRQFDFVIDVDMDGLCWRSARLELITIDRTRHRVEFQPPFDGVVLGYAEYMPFIASTAITVDDKEEGVGYIEYQCNPRGGLEVPRTVLGACTYDGYSRRAARSRLLTSKPGAQ
jgi:hypothetical protein